MGEIARNELGGAVRTTIDDDDLERPAALPFQRAKACLNGAPGAIGSYDDG